MGPPTIEEKDGNWNYIYTEAYTNSSHHHDGDPGACFEMHNRLCDEVILRVARSMDAKKDE
jgi:hypothetical protein